MRRQRLDAELVRRGLARSRQQAHQMVEQRHVSVSGRTADKAASQVDLDAAIVVHDGAGVHPWVSRGALKLAGALDAFAAGPTGAPQVFGRRALDAGAGTGGFTDVLLHRGARHVVAVDVGYGQLAWRLRQDDRVSILERTNVRELRPEQVAPRPQLVVADLSFISLRLVMPTLAACATEDADHVLMVKPQFEVGRERLGRGGVVRDARLRLAAVCDVADAADILGLGLVAVTASPLPGPSGNVEYFLWLRREAPGDPTRDADRRAAAARAAVADGPQTGLDEVAGR